MHSMYPNFNNIKTISVGIDENEPQVNFLFASKLWDVTISKELSQELD